MKIYKTFLTVGLLLVGASANAASWLKCDGDSEKKIKFSGNSTTAEISTWNYPANWRSKIKDAIKIVNTNPSPFWINTVERSNGVGDLNGENEVYYADIDFPGVARMWPYCYNWSWEKTFLGIVYDSASGIEFGLEEVDVILDSTTWADHDNNPSTPDVGTPRPWTLSSDKSQVNEYGGSKIMAESVLVHEFGHFLGLMHVNAEYNIMGDSWDHMITQNGKTRSYFGEDASKGARQLYGTQNTWYRDLSVSHFRYTGVSGEYSAHGRTRPAKKNGGKWLGLPIYSGTSDGSVIEPIYGVDLGDRIRFEYTVENNGKQTENNVRGGIYISTNDWISTSDRRISTHTWSSIAAQGAAYTFTYEITIPNDLDQQRVYWVGYIIDDNNRVPEKIGNNNAAYVPVWIN